MNDQPPDIILIITEQQRGDCLGADGHPVLQTPTMDELAISGARFRRCYSDCPVCMPARRTILAGQFPVSHGLLANAPGFEWQPEATLAQVLRDHGYQTRWIGRGMHQYPERARFGYDEVEDGGYKEDTEYYRWFKANAPNDCGGWFGGGIMHNDWSARPWPLDDYLHPTNWTIERALTFLRRRDPTCPVFLTLSFIEAHPPLQPPAFYYERYLRTGVPDRYIGDWAEQPVMPTSVSNRNVDLNGEALLNARAAYYGCINHLDDQLRRLFNPVVGLRAGSDTIVCFTSDHGEMLGDHYRWAKSLPYEGSARVPLLIAAPGLPQRSVIDTPVSLSDIMPTLLDLAGIDIPPSVDGKSLVPLLRGDGEFDRDYVHMEHAGFMQALTDGREKYAWQTQTGDEQLFDLENDPGELHDLAAEKPERLKVWRQRLIQRLDGRPEGFTDGKELIAGRPKMNAINQPGEPMRGAYGKFVT